MMYFWKNKFRDSSFRIEEIVKDAVIWGISRTGLILLMLGLVGCASMRASKVGRCVDNESFHQALSLLEEQGAGAVISAEAHPKMLKARTEYQKSVEAKYLGLSSSKRKLGKPRAAQAVIAEGLSLCSWSNELKEEKVSVELLITKIDLHYVKWRGNATSFENDILLTCRFLASTQPLCHDLNDSPQLFAMYEVAKSSLLRACANYVIQTEYGNITEEYEEIRDVLKTLAEDGLLHRTVPTVVESVVSLPPNITSSSDLPDGMEGKYLLIKELRKKKTNDDIVYLANSLWEKINEWIAEIYLPALIETQAPYDLIELGERMLPVIDAGAKPQLKMGLGDAYLHRALKWEGAGVESLLSLVFVQRRQMLVAEAEDVEKTDPVVARALSALNQTLPISHYVNIDVDDSIDPDFHSLISIWILAEIMERTESWHEWQLYKEDEQQNKLEIKVTEADLVWDTTDELGSVYSKYLSHYQDVPNPMKSFYETQVSTKRFSLNLAESSYNSAVNSHNIYPTQYSLNSVNFAKNNYLNALNAYNSAVQMYNATPSTISEPVYLSYSFLEGNLDFGWKLSLTGMVNETPFSTSGRSIETDRVRIGTKHSDTNTGRRRDDGVDIDFSADRSLLHLSRACSKAMDITNLDLFGFTYALNSALSGTEENILKWLLHPWGPQVSSKLDLPSWTRSVDISEVLVIEEIPPPAVSIARSASSGSDFTAETLKEACGKFVCQILVMDESDSEQRGHGSGTLISADGLILTCAHVVDGSNFKIKFHEGPYEGTYETSIVYVNNKHDVALLQAEGLSAASWANIRLSKDTAGGEEIIAIGNPSLEEGGVNILGVSKGIVSNPEADISGRSKMIADISIASGSSGGPLFSTKDGELVGVVLAVASEHITEGHGASGFTCLAAPSFRLPEWTGLEVDVSETKGEDAHLELAMQGMNNIGTNSITSDSVISEKVATLLHTNEEPDASTNLVTEEIISSGE